MTRDVCEHFVPVTEHCDQCETSISPKGQKVHLTKHELLRILRLLSGLESALCYQTDRASLPAYLLGDLNVCTGILERKILK